MGERFWISTAGQPPSGLHTLTPARVSHLSDEKRRRVLRFDPADMELHRSTADLVKNAIHAATLDCVRSFAPGDSPFLVARELARFARRGLEAQRKSGAKIYGLHALRGDIASYGDSIPVADDSPLWPRLEAAVATITPSPMPLLRTLLRHPFIEGDVVTEPRVGLPTGSPLVPLIDNLYATPLDEALSTIPGAYYARYGDDFVFVHADADVARAAAAKIPVVLAALGLRLNEEKRRFVFWNAAGRSSPDARGSAFIDYLGVRIGCDGTLRLPPKKRRAFEAELHFALLRTQRWLPNEPNERARHLCALLVARFTHDHLVSAAELPPFLWIDDRRQLAELDRSMALRVAEIASGVRGPQAFRVVSYRALRDLGLPSLVRMRNSGSAPRAIRASEPIPW